MPAGRNPRRVTSFQQMTADEALGQYVGYMVRPNEKQLTGSPHNRAPCFLQFCLVSAHSGRGMERLSPTATLDHSACTGAAIPPCPAAAAHCCPFRHRSPANAGRPGGGHRAGHPVCPVSVFTLLSCFSAVLASRHACCWCYSGFSAIAGCWCCPICNSCAAPCWPAPPCPTTLFAPACFPAPHHVPPSSFCLQHCHPHLHAAERLYRPVPLGLSSWHSNHTAAPTSTHTCKQDAGCLQAGRNEAASSVQLRWRIAPAGRHATLHLAACAAAGSRRRACLQTQLLPSAKTPPMQFCSHLSF